MPNCDVCYGEKTEDCPDDCLTSHIRYGGKPKRVDFEMKYIGWNLGAVRIERRESKGDIEILEMSIDGIDILKLLDSSLFKEETTNGR